MSFASHLEKSADLIRAVGSSALSIECEKAAATIVTALKGGAPVLVCGNGGSACDAMHITGELVGRFLRIRRAYNVVCISANPAILTAWSNDYAFDTVFSRQVEAHAKRGGVLWGLSTSGNSPNVIAAFEESKKHGMLNIGMTGAGGGRLADLSDVLIAVPSADTPLIQQAHICIYHYICETVESLLSY